MKVLYQNVFNLVWLPLPLSQEWEEYYYPARPFTQPPEWCNFCSPFFTFFLHFYKLRGNVLCCLQSRHFFALLFLGLVAVGAAVGPAVVWQRILCHSQLMCRAKITNYKAVCASLAIAAPKNENKSAEKTADTSRRTRTSQKDWQLLKMKRGNYVLVWLPVAFEACFTAMFNRGFHLHTYFSHWVCGCLRRGGPCLLYQFEGQDTLLF